MTSVYIHVNSCHVIISIYRDVNQPFFEIESIVEKMPFWQ